MGAAAFLMVATTGISYLTIMVAAIIPSIIYYLPLVLTIQLWGKKHEYSQLREDIDKRSMIVLGSIFVFIVILLVYLLVERLSPGRVAIYATGVALVISFFFRESRMDFSGLVKNLNDGLLAAAKIGIAMTCIGLVAQTAITTGLGVKTARLLLEIPIGGMLFPLFISMIACIILGMGMPTVAAYGLVAIILGPALTNGLDIGMLPAHFFLFYFAALSAVTPPVALASLTAAGLAEADYLRSAVISFVMVLPAFLTPFVFIKVPGILRFHVTAIPYILLLILATFALTLGSVGYINKKIGFSMIDRALLISISLIFVLHFYYFGIPLLWAIPVILAYLLVKYILVHKKRSAELPA